MSVPTVTAGRIFDGQLRGVVGERNRLEFEKFNYVGLSKVRMLYLEVNEVIYLNKLLINLLSPLITRQ